MALEAAAYPFLILHGAGLQSTDRSRSRKSVSAEGKHQRNGSLRRMAIPTKSSGRGDRPRVDLLSGQELFESFLRRRQADGDFVSKAADALWRKEAIQLDEEKRLKVREKLTELEKAKEVDGNGSFLKLSQARRWDLGQDAAPVNPGSPTLEREMQRNDLKKQSLLEYEALKRELSVMTAGVGACVGAYCFVTLSPEASISYAIGALASLGYLQLLYGHVDQVSKDNVADIFVRRRRKRIGITSTDLQESFEKALRGSSRALSSPRLMIPPALYGLWALSSQFGEDLSIHLEVAPLLVGFFAYKAAALLQAYRDNKDLVFRFQDPKSEKDA